MSWGIAWKRPSDSFRIALRYGDSGSDDAAADRSPPETPITPPGSLQIDLDWTAGDDEDQVALRLQSQLMVALPPPHDAVALELAPRDRDRDGEAVGVEMTVVRRREPLRAVTMSKTAGSGQQTDAVGVLTRLLRSKLDGSGCGEASDEHWNSTTTFGMQGLGLLTLPVELTRLSILEKLYLDNNKLTVLPPELGQLKNLKVLTVDNNMLASVPVELRQCVKLVELSLEHNKLVRPLLDFRAMAELRTLRLFGNPLEFLPEILPLHNLRHLSLANIRIEADENLKSVNVKIETEVSSYFVASRHKLSAFFSLIFRFSSCHHPLLASALAKIVQDGGNRAVISKDENAMRQLISMISSENRHVVEQACSALSCLAADRSLVMQLIKCDIMQPIQSLLKSVDPDELISVLEVVVNLAFASDIVAQKILTRDVLKSLKTLCAHTSVQVQKLALYVVGNLAFCLENRRTLATSESLNELLLRLTTARELCVKRAAARALAILGENENLRRAIKGRQVGKRGLRILSMDGGGMKGLATIQILKQIEQGTGKRIHEMFDLICGTSTGGMLAIAIGIKQMTLEQCEDVYKKLGKVVFTERTPKDNEAATWMEKLDQLYKSSSQNIRVVVQGSKYRSEPFERLLKEMCADEEGDLLIESAVKNIPKVFVVSTLVSVMPAQPFLFRNYQYPVGTLEVPFGGEPESPIIGGRSLSASKQQGAYMGSCKHRVWEAIRASSAAPYYFDDFSDDTNRWQDGAILANNPTIVAIREAQVLWPDTRIDCVVSVGCGSVPTKVRKGGWRHIDTWQVLIESACSVERVEEIINTFIPMIPEINYFRFNPVDERCDMELDETDPAVWPKLEAATQEYILNHAEEFKGACELLAPPLDEDKLSDKPNGHLSSIAEVENSPSLGRRRMVLLLEASSSPDVGKETHHARSLESFCTRKGIRLSSMNNISELPKPAAMFRTPFTSPLFSGSFPSSPLMYSPEAGAHKMSRIDLVPPLNLDGPQGMKVSSSPPSSPTGIRLCSVPAQLLHEKLYNLTHVGMVHLALQNDSVGAILSWRNDVFVIAEPGDAAERFLESVKLSLSQGCSRKDVVSLAKIVTVADLVAWQPCFQAGGVLQRYIGRQTHVLEDGQEISAFLFRHTVPAIHLTPDDVRWMIGAWRERIIICTGKCGPCPSLLKAFLDNGAKAVIASSVEPPEAHPGFFGSGDLNGVENGRFEIGDDEADIEEQEPSSPMSDWEESEPEQSSFWEDEEDLSHFVCRLYDGIFRGLKVNVALQQALAPHPKLKYVCHLPNVPNLLGK